MLNHFVGSVKSIFHSKIYLLGTEASRLTLLVERMQWNNWIIGLKFLNNIHILYCECDKALFVVTKRTLSSYKFLSKIPLLKENKYQKLCYYTFNNEQTNVLKISLLEQFLSSSLVKRLEDQDILLLTFVYLQYCFYI